MCESAACVVATLWQRCTFKSFKYHELLGLRSTSSAFAVIPASSLEGIKAPSESDAAAYCSSTPDKKARASAWTTGAHDARYARDIAKPRR